MKILQPISKTIVFATALAVAAAAAEANPAVIGLPAGEPSIVVQWNAALCGVFEESSFHISLHAQARIFAIVHLAMHDAVATVDPRIVDRERKAYASLAASAAARQVVAAAMDPEKRRFAAIHDRARAAITNEGEAAGAVQIGERAAAEILRRRRTDGWPLIMANEQAAAAILRNSLETDLRPPRESSWAKLAPFRLKKARQFEPEPPYFAYSNGVVLPNDRLRKQNRIGAPGDITAPLPALQAWRALPLVQWNRAAQSLAERNPAALLQQTHAFAALNAALADALLAVSYWNDEYATGRANPPIATIENLEEYYRAINDAQLPVQPERLPRGRRSLTEFPALSAGLAGAAEAILVKNFGGGEALFARPPFANPPAARTPEAFDAQISLHAAARECAWVMLADGSASFEGCLAGYELGVRIGEYVLKQSPR